jgi:molybdenum cofactor biosynthesis enzyme
MAKHIYAFEGIPEQDLPRPPLAALRALRIAGVALSRAGWLGMPVAGRLDLVQAGARERVDVAEVQKALESAPIRELKLIPGVGDPPSDVVPAVLAGATGPVKPFTLEFWRSVSGLDRHVFVMLAANTRLLYRAMAEIALRSRFGVSVLPSRGWTGTLAHAEVRMAPEVVRTIQTPELLDGRACILARVAGIRAARWASEILDLHAHVATGPVEVGFSIEATRAPTAVLWQAHVSTIDGQFSASASMLAVVTAAAALHDMVTRAGASASIDAARLVDEPWFSLDAEDEVTVFA